MSLRWFLTAFAFAMAVGLAIGTAAIKAKNVRLRRVLQQREQEVEALEATLEFEAAEWRRAVEPRRLVEHWQRLAERRRE